ncbi:protein BONZAI 1-like [Olea europaea var. sylvestris]|uniref:BONZAI 1-like n=1 Tax=Olea europaea subsp. europaea TaxID=158383 RepID=A0A8S0P9Z1_OLEEU|nr:protein BONZAI 1-like [Olea europaea var. sylvestris]CAA2935223.1 BONZAI 1-like [Olea europaea subsp. europaea]
MGNCCSDVAGAQSAIGGTASFHTSSAVNAPNEAVEAFLNSRGHQLLYSQIELSLSASNLRDRDVLSKSDPMAVLYIKGRDGSLQELGRTEVVLNSLNPKWIRKYTLTYQFEMVQYLVFRIYDVDTQFRNTDVKALKLEEQQFLGETTCALSQIVTKSNRSLTLDLGRGEPFSTPAHTQKFGQLTVYAEESVAAKTTAELILRCSDLESKDLFSKSDPFLVISKLTETGIAVPICKTEVLKNDRSPKWKSIFLNIQQIGSKDSPIIIECFDFNSNGKHDLIGKVQKSLADLEKLHSVGMGENLFIPVSVGQNHQSKVLKSQLFVDTYSEKIQYTFLDYLAGGFELNFMVAIDFTASNGNPRLPDSLHYIDPSGRPNAYQRAILEVGGVLQFYDSDKKFPAWGFGARPIDGPVSHCFNLNGSSNYCEVDGIQGIMTAYTSALCNVSLAGPTLFGPVVTNAAFIASQSVANNEWKYFILLIITDGVITDLQETKDALVSASDLPLSILIIGVGGADFKEMEILDADKGERLESSTGRVASRDIVQFVPFREVHSGDISVVQSLVAELPSQFLAYMRARDISPNK